MNEPRGTLISSGRGQGGTHDAWGNLVDVEGTNELVLALRRDALNRIISQNAIISRCGGSLVDTSQGANALEGRS